MVHCCYIKTVTQGPGQWEAAGAVAPTFLDEASNGFCPLSVFRSNQITTMKTWESAEKW